MPRYVILEHNHPHLHYDFMLEDEGGLLTWRLAVQPDWSRSMNIAAEPLALHRVEYLDYEGPVSGGRGRVVRVAAGTFTWVDRTAVSWSLQLQMDQHTMAVCWSAECPQQLLFGGNHRPILIFPDV